MKQETHYLEENFFNDDSLEQNHVEEDPVVSFKDTADETEETVDVEDRQTVIMEKLVRLLSSITVCLDVQSTYRY